MIQVYLNGKELSVRQGATLADLVADTSPVGARLAVERNGVVVPKSKRHEVALCAGDRVELVVAVGGG